MIKNRKEILELLQKLNEENASEILEQLIDIHDTEGKNAPIIALEEGYLEAFHIMINPVITKDGYKLYYDPFNNGVVRGSKRLRWNTVFNHNPNTYPTKTNFYPIYSPYSYLENMKLDGETKRLLIADCHTIDYDITSQMKVANLPVKDQVQCELYTDKDIIRYIPIPLHKIARRLIKQNIPVTKYSCDAFGYLEVVIEFGQLSEENKETAINLLTQIEDNFVISVNNYLLHVTMIPQKNATIGEIEEELNRILGKFKYQELKRFKIDVDEAYIKTMRFLTILNKPIDKNLSKIELCQKVNPLLTLSSDGTFFYEHPAIKEREEQKELKKKGE
jgi:hypothetical protein